MRNTFVGTPCWMAPEVMEQLHGYDFKADIWSFGITALELAHGHAPFSKYPPMKVLLMTLQNAPPSLDYERDKKFSKSFKQMIASCLVKDPSKRPSAKKLMKHSFFKQARSNDYISRTLLEGLPALGDRIQALKKKEEDMLAQKKMPDGEKEELSQNEYKRGISSWTFNLEDVKAQASLIPDDDILFDKDQGGSCALDGSLDPQFSSLSHVSQASDIEESDLTNSQPLGAPPSNESGKLPNNRCEKSDDDTSIASSSHEQTISQCCSPRQVENAENVANGISPDVEAIRKIIESSSTQLHHRRASSSACVYTLEIPSLRSESFRSPKQPDSVPINEVATGSQGVDETMSEPTPRTSKASPVNADEIEEKTRIPVVQQRGRFKVTSENVDLEKASQSLQRSHSMQVITPQTTISLPSIDAQSMNLLACSLFPLLQSFLQTNITQRESILSLMKQISSQVSSGDPNVSLTGDGGCSSANIAAIEKSLLEVAHDREKELVHELAAVQWRLIRTQEELQKLKTDNAHFNN